MGRWNAATGLVLLVLVAVALLTFRQYGATYDEEGQQEIGRSVLSWYATGFHDRKALQERNWGSVQLLYGGLFEAIAELAASASPLDPLETRHLVNALWSIAGIAGTALLARRLGGPRAGFLATVLLATTPAWWGHSFANPKDIPFAVPFPWLLWALLRAADGFPRPALGRIAAVGAALGVALGVRPGGLIALAPVCAGVWAVRALPVLRRLPRGERLPAVARIAGAFALVLAISWPLMLAAWPFGLVNPLSAPLRAAAEASTHKVEVPVHFAGAWYAANDVPRSYAPTLFAVTLPEAWFVAAAGAVAALALRRRAPAGSPERFAAHALVAGAGLLPIVAAVVLRPTLYDGIRHFLFVMPPLAAAVAAGVSGAVDRLPRWASRTVLVGFGVATLVTVADMMALHPYQYVYFNRLAAGGVAKAGEAYELDYWGMSYREGMAWLAGNYRPELGRPVRVGVFGQTHLANRWIKRDPQASARFDVSGNSLNLVLKRADVVLATTRWFRHRTPGRVLHVVQRMGAPLLYVIELDQDGRRYQRFEAGDAAIELVVPAEWVVNPFPEPGIREAQYEIGRSAHYPELELRIGTAGTSRVPEVEALRDEVTARAVAAWRTAPGRLDGRSIEGPQMRGWFVTNAPRPPGAGAELTLGAARVGATTVYFDARVENAAEGVTREILEMLRTIRPAGMGGRRRP